MLRSSHGESSGAFHPLAPQLALKMTLHPYGGSFSRMLFSFCDATFASTVGGSLSDKLTDVPGRSTLPPLPVGGRPSAPMIDRAGRHARLRISSVGSLLMGRACWTNGNFV